MATREEKKTLKSAGKDEKKILKSLKKLQKYPRVRELFRIIASLFRRKKIRNIKEIAKNRDIRKTVEGLNYEERKMYAKHLKELGFPTLEEFLGSVKKAQVVLKKAPKKGLEKVADIKKGAERFQDEIQELRDRGSTPLLRVLNDHIKYLGNDSFFQKAHKTAKQQSIIERSLKSVDFYEDYAAEYATSFNYRSMLRQGGKKKANFFLGRMYFYKYLPDPKTLDATFDMYPLMFIVNKSDEEFEGINFHYMTPKARAMTMGNLFDYLNNNEYKTNTRLLFNSLKKVIRNNRKFRYAKYAYRRYNYSNISSKIIEVHPLDWEIAMFCPTERFYSKQRRRLPDRVVWKQTAIRVRKRK